MQRVSGEVDGTSASGQSESVETSNQSKRPLRKGKITCWFSRWFMLFMIYYDIISVDVPLVKHS